MIGQEKIREFMDGLIGEMAVNHSFYGLSYKEYIDQDSSIAQDVKEKMVIGRKSLITTRLWQYRIEFIRHDVVFAKYTICEEIEDVKMKALRPKVKHIREFFTPTTIDQIWEIALQQLTMYSLNQFYEIERQNQHHKNSQLQNVHLG